MRMSVDKLCVSRVPVGPFDTPSRRRSLSPSSSGYRRRPAATHNCGKNCVDRPTDPAPSLREARSPGELHSTLPFRRGMDSSPAVASRRWIAPPLPCPACPGRRRATAACRIPCSPIPRSRRRNTNASSAARPGTFVGLEAEIPDPGDVKTTFVGADAGDASREPTTAALSCGQPLLAQGLAVVRRAVREPQEPHVRLSRLVVRSRRASCAASRSANGVDGKGGMPPGFEPRRSRLANACASRRSAVSSSPTLQRRRPNRSKTISASAMTENIAAVRSPDRRARLSAPDDARQLEALHGERARSVSRDASCMRSTRRSS